MATLVFCLSSRENTFLHSGKHSKNSHFAVLHFSYRKVRKFPANLHMDQPWSYSIFMPICHKSLHLHLGQKMGWRATAAVQWMSIYYRSNLLIFHLLAPDIDGWLNSLRTILSIMYCKQGYASAASAWSTQSSGNGCTHGYTVRTLYRGITVASRLSIFLK